MKTFAIDRKIKDLAADEIGGINMLSSVLEWMPILLLCAKQGDYNTTDNHKKSIRVALTTELVLKILVQSLKYAVRRQRPDKSCKLNSFPSGHTATAFAGAEFLYQHFKKGECRRRYGGYAVAILTGWLRIKGNRHWFTDVLAGAVIGIIVTKTANAIYCKKGLLKSSRSTKILGN